MTNCQFKPDVVYQHIIFIIQMIDGYHTMMVYAPTNVLH